MKHTISLSFLFVAVAAAFAAGDSGGNASANLVRNGSFESPELPTDSFGAVYLTPGWTASTGMGLQLQGKRVSGLSAHDGRQWLRLDLPDSRVIHQDLATTPGQRYRLSFAYANSPTSSMSSITVFWGSTQIATINTTLTEFQLASYSVAATSYTTRLTLQSAGPTDGDGDLVDNVSVVPEYAMVIPQFADGQAANGDWRTTVLFSNPHDRDVRVDMLVYAQDGSELDPTLRFSRTLRARETAVYNSPAFAQITRQGWAKIEATGELSLTAIYRSREGGRADYEAAVAPRAPTYRMVGVFDNTAGFVSAMAVVNPRDTPILLDFTLRSDSGVVVATRRIPMEARNHRSFALVDLFAQTQGIRGSVEIVGRTDGDTPAEFSAMGLRFNQTGPFASLPY